jgi:hypothetical protein
LSSALTIVGGVLLGGAAAEITPAQWDQTSFTGTAFIVFALAYLLCSSGIVQAFGGASAMIAVVGTINALNLHEPLSTRISASALIVVAMIWAAATGLALLRESSIGILVVGVSGFVGSEMLINSTAWVDEATWHGFWPGYLTLVVFATAGFWAYIRLRDLAALLVGVVALATVVPQSVLDYTSGSLGAGGALLLIGLSIVGASAIGFRLMHRRA